MNLFQKTGDLPNEFKGEFDGACCVAFLVRGRNVKKEGHIIYCKTVPYAVSCVPLFRLGVVSLYRVHFNTMMEHFCYRILYCQKTTMMFL
jgi:hypothetical protein